MTSPSDILTSRIHNLQEYYSNLSLQIDSYCDKLASYSFLYQNKEDNEPYSVMILSYRIKLQNIRLFILRANEKVSRMQQKLNNIRFQLPKGHVYVENGPFRYRCVYRGGVRYRNFPSNAALILKEKPLVEFDDVIQVMQRVFITAEESVFLVRGI